MSHTRLNITSFNLENESLLHIFKRFYFQKEYILQVLRNAKDQLPSITEVFEITKMRNFQKPKVSYGYPCCLVANNFQVIIMNDARRIKCNDCSMALR
jgi:hypothetical protein